MSTVEEYNKQELWRDVANHLQVATEAVEHALEALEDLHDSSFNETLGPIEESLRWAASDARDRIAS